MSRLTVCLLMLAVTTSSGYSSADEAPAKLEARAYYKEGVAFVREGDFVGAVEAFRRAYAVSPNYAVLFNLGQAHAALGQSVEAVHSLERFLTDGGDHIAPARRREVAAIIARERAHIARIELDVSPEGAEVFIDGRRLGLAPIEAEDVPAGDHVIVARLAGYMPAIETFTLTGGSKREVALTLAAEPHETPADVKLARRKAVDCAKPRVPSSKPPLARAGTDHRGELAIGSAVGGIIIAGAAAATFAWNEGRYEGWHRDRQRFDDALAAGTAGAPAPAESDKLAGDAAKIRRTDDLVLGMALAAGSALVTAGVLWFTRTPVHHR